jgi:hypothetical protein
LENSDDLKDGAALSIWWKHLLCTLAALAPFGFVLQQGEGWHYFHVMAFLWSFTDFSDTHGTAMSGFSFIDPLSIILTGLLSSLRFLFVYYVLQHSHGLTSRRNVWTSAVLSQLPFSVYVLGSFLSRSWTGLIINMGGPIPLLVLVGLIIDHFKGREPLTKPWKDE